MTIFQSKYGPILENEPFFKFVKLMRGKIEKIGIYFNVESPEEYFLTNLSQ